MTEQPHSERADFRDSSENASIFSVQQNSYLTCKVEDDPLCCPAGGRSSGGFSESGSGPPSPVLKAQLRSGQRRREAIRVQPYSRRGSPSRHRDSRFLRWEQV